MTSTYQNNTNVSNAYKSITTGNNIDFFFSDWDGAVQQKARTCTKACLKTTGCHTFVIRGNECYLTSFNACQNAGKRFLLEWDGNENYRSGIATIM